MWSGPVWSEWIGFLYVGFFWVLWWFVRQICLYTLEKYEMSRLYTDRQQAVLVNKPIKAYIFLPQRLRQLPLVLPWTCGRCASLQPGGSRFSNSHLLQLDEKCWKCLFWPLRAPLCSCRITSRVPLVHRWWWESYFRKEKCTTKVWILIAFRFKLNKKVNNN